MLNEMLPFSLKYASDERHDLQSMAVGMVEQTLLAKKSALQASIATQEADVKALKDSESALGQAVKDAEAALDTQNELCDAKAVLHASAMEAETSSKANLTKLQEAQKEAEEKLETMKTEKAAIDAAFGEHFGPCQEGEAKEHFKKLEPFLKKIEIE